MTLEGVNDACSPRRQPNVQISIKSCNAGYSEQGRNKRTRLLFSRNYL